MVYGLVDGSNIDFYRVDDNSFLGSITFGQQLVPAGVISQWYGAVADVPLGYGLCDGTVYARLDGSGTITSPDLRDKFIRGGGGASPPGTTGGSATILQANLPAITLNGGIVPATLAGTLTSADILQVGGNFLTTNGAGAAYGFTTAVGANAVGLNFNPSTQTTITGITSMDIGGAITADLGGSDNDFEPPYLVLCYIMKL